VASVCGPFATANDEKLAGSGNGNGDGDGDEDEDAAAGDGDDDRNVDKVGPSLESSGCPVEAAAAASPAKTQREQGEQAARKQE